MLVQSFPKHPYEHLESQRELGHKLDGVMYKDPDLAHFSYCASSASLASTSSLRHSPGSIETDRPNRQGSDHGKYKTAQELHQLQWLNAAESFTAEIRLQT